jgi:PhnB protein
VTSALSPYVSFRSGAREALTFYQSVFGGQLDISTFGEFGGGDGVDADGVMHGQLRTAAGYTLMAADTPPGMDVQQGDNVTLALFGDDAEQLRGYFTALAEGGTVSVPLEKQMWGDEYGSLTDKFGVNWMANISPASA